jgi:hypothetical protein
LADSETFENRRECLIAYRLLALGLVEWMNILSPLMPRKPKNAGPDGDGMWINPNSSLKGARGDRAWENRNGGIPSNSRYLELADIALGLKKPAPKKKGHAVHYTSKGEPYYNNCSGSLRV